MGTSNSSKETRQRAKALAEAIGAYHTDLNIDSMVTTLIALFRTVTGFMPRFKVHGGSGTENLALQNIQARLRMITGEIRPVQICRYVIIKFNRFTGYMFAQLLPTGMLQ